MSVCFDVMHAEESLVECADARVTQLGTVDARMRGQHVEKSRGRTVPERHQGNA